jgi:hypothetical protein
VGARVKSTKEEHMSVKGQALPSDVFDEIVRLLLERYGDEWITDNVQNGHFVTAMTSVVQTAEGMHLIGKPDSEHNSMDFNLWVEHPVEDVWEADELAFGVFSQIAEDIFLASRQIEERGVRYRFVTGSMDNGHLGSLNFTGPHAKEFVDIYRMRITRGQHYHA